MPEEIRLDAPGLRETARQLDFTSSEVAAVVTAMGRLPEPATGTYGGQPAVEAMRELLSAWSEELAALERAGTMMSEAAETTADEWAGTDEQIAAGFDLFVWPEEPG